MRASPVPFAGPKRHNDPGIAFDALPTIDGRAGVARPLTTISTRDAVEADAKFSPRVITPLGNDVTMRDATVRSKPKASTGRTASNSATASP
jgi:hypothetical protein